MMSLELILKGVGGGKESKLIISPSSSHSRKTSVEWLKALKKVSLGVERKGGGGGGGGREGGEGEGRERGRGREEGRKNSGAVLYILICSSLDRLSSFSTPTSSWIVLLKNPTSICEHHYTLHIPLFVLWQLSNWW